jgi:hypothetical protein
MTDDKIPAPLLTPRDVARWLAVTTDTLEHWRSRGAGPPCAKLDTAPTSPVRYRRQDVEDWLREREVRRGRA